MAFRKKRRDPFREIQACLQKRDYEGALDWFHTLLQKDPKNTQIRLRFADTLALAGSKNEAVKQFRVVADELAEKGFMIRAIAINKKILQLDPRQTDVHQKLAEMNEGRSASSAERQTLAQALTSPDAPLARATEVAPVPEPETAGVTEAKTDAPPAALPELSLEESMAMEFGAASEAEPAAPPGEADETDEPVATPAEPGGFELLEEKPEPPSDAPLDFEEETIELGDGEPVAEHQPETEAEPEPEPEIEVELSLTGLEELPAELEVTIPGEETEVFELEAETEPKTAVDSVESLAEALGEDIDSLIDSIIDDVGSSAKGEQPAEGEPPTHIPLFSDLTMAEFIDVAILLVRRVVKTGEIAVREGEPGDSMFIISTGEVRATVEHDGQQVPVATLRDGDFFGEMAVLSGEPRTATVTAVKNTEVLELSRENLKAICSRHPHVEAKIRLAYDERVGSDRSR